MARPLKIPFIADVAGFLKGTRDIESSLDDVSGSLDDLSREAQRAGQDAGQDLSDGLSDGANDAARELERAGDKAGEAFGDGLTKGDPGKELANEVESGAESARKALDSEMNRAAADVESATERMEASFKGTFDDVPRNARTNLTQMSKSVDDGVSRSSAAMGEVKQEAMQNASETFSSFDGSAKSLVDGVQGTFGGLVSSLGPLGMAIGAAGAAGIGAVMGHLDKAKEKAQEFRSEVEGLAGQLRESGRDTPALDDMIERLEEMAEAGENGESKLQAVHDAIENIGSAADPDAIGQFLAGADVPEIERIREQLQGMAGDLDAAGLMSGDAAAEHAASAAVIVSSIDSEMERREEASALNERLNELGLKTLEQRIAAEEAADERRTASAERAHESFTENTERLRETNQGMADSITSSYDEVSSALDKASEDGELSIEELETAMREAAERQQASSERWSWAAENLSQNQINALLDMGEQGEQALETIMNSPPSATGETLTHLENQGARKGQAEREGVIRGADGRPIAISVKPELDRRALATARDELSESVHVRIVPGVRQIV